MFDVGFPEIMMIGAVALIVIGPERLPDVARKVGRWVAKFQRFVRGVRSDVARELESGELKALIGDQREQINELRGMVKDAQRDIEKTTSAAVKDAESSFSEIENSISQPASSSSGDSSTDALPDASSKQSNSSNN